MGGKGERSGRPRQVPGEGPDQTSPRTFKQLDRNKKLTIATTTTLSRIRGFTINLLFLLENVGLRTCEVAELTQKSNAYVSVYLCNMRKYGLTMKKGHLWNLTSLGRDFLTYLKQFDKHKNRIYTIIHKSKKINKRYTKDKQKMNKSSASRKPKQVSIQPWLRKASLDETETVVVEVLMEHYNRTGGPFLWFPYRSYYELAERLKVNPDLLPKALRKLTEDQIIYVWRHRKIGLKKAFIEKLRATQRRGREEETS